MALTHVGSLTLDYQNGHFPPGVVGIEGLYVSFPLLEAAGNTIFLVGGRADLRTLAEPSIWTSGAKAIDFGPDATLGSLRISNGSDSTLPVLSGSIAGVTGDVTIRDNPLLPHADALAFVAHLGSIGGATTVCGNLDDAACPAP